MRIVRSLTANQSGFPTTHAAVGYRLAVLVLALLVSLVALAACAEDEPEAAESSKGTLVFNDLNWNSAQIQNRIAQYIVEKGYDYPTDVVFGATLPLFQGLRRGDSHITLEIWLPNQDEAWNEAVVAGEVVSIGLSLGKDWQSAFVIPNICRSNILSWIMSKTLKTSSSKSCSRLRKPATRRVWCRA